MGPSPRIVMRFVVSLCMVVGMLLLPSVNALDDSTPVTTPPGWTSASAASEFDRLPLSFVPNVGQTDPDVHFEARGMGSSLFFTPGQVVLAISAPVVTGEMAHQPVDWPTPELPFRRVTGVSPIVAHLRFDGANPAVEIAGDQRMPGEVNYFIGSDPTRWHAGLPTFASITYQQLYPGIDLHYDGTQGVLKGTYLIAPGVNPAQIRWRYDEATSVHVDEATGDLLVRLASAATTSEGPEEDSGRYLTERAPVAWQDIDGLRVTVVARYVIADDGSIGFTVGDYDPDYPLVVDPTLVYSAFLGGSANDYAQSVAVDSEKNIYIVGWTQSANFPTANPQDGTLGGSQDVFVARLNAAGNAFIYSTYLGGSNNEEGFGIAVDALGSAYVTGRTLSTNFPTLNPFQATLQGVPGTCNAFITKLNSSGSLLYSTYLGRDGEGGWDIAVDQAGNAYVTGQTWAANFPTVNPLQPTNHGSYDAFVSKLNNSGDALLYSTYLGGGGHDIGVSIALDSENNIYIVGGTNSGNFPTANPFDETLNGSDSFVAKLNASGSALVYSTYLGGGNTDQVRGIAVDSAGNAYITGRTTSSDFPTVSPLDATLSGPSDVFLTKFSPSGSLLFSTFMGGSSDEYTSLDPHGNNIAMDRAGNVYIVGDTTSTDFPAINALQATNRGGNDAFVTRIIQAGGVYTYGYSTYLGGSGNDTGYGIAVDRLGNAYVTGETSSSNFPTTTNTIQPGYAGGTDAFVAKISGRDLAISKSVTPPSLVGPGQALTYTLIYTNYAGDIAAGVLITDHMPVTLTNVSYTHTGAIITPTGSISFTWQVADLLPGTGGTFTVTGIVSSAISGAFSLTNLATIATTDMYYADADPDDNSSVVSTTIDAEAPYAPSLISPVNGAVFSDTLLTLTWNASPDPDVEGYLLKWNDVISDVGNVTQYALGVTTDGIYTWTIAAYDAVHNTSSFTDTWALTVDSTSPQITLVSPPDGASGVAIAASVVVTFSEPIDDSTLTYTVVPDPGGWSTWWNSDATALVLSHSFFAYSATCTVTINSASDLVGNSVANAPFEWRFTTVPYKLYLPLVAHN